MTEEQPQRVYELRHVYLKDLSFESPNSPAIFSEKSASPGIEVEVNVRDKSLNEENTLFESVLMIKIVAKFEDTAMFLIEVLQAALVEVSGFSDEDREKILNIAVPTSLLPFARETVSTLAGKGGFPPLLLRQMNFDNLYREKLNAQQEKTEANPTEH